MNKIKTIFKRDDVTKKVINELEVVFPDEYYVTEKVDGTNIRVTIRNGECVRIECRKNPSKAQKEKGIIHPWYRDIDIVNDKWILKAVNNTNFDFILDGEYSAEAYGEKIQGNPLNVKSSGVFVFGDYMTLRSYRYYKNIDFSNYYELKEWLFNQRSHFNISKKIEGLVFYDKNYKPFGKIKLKDF